MKNTISGTMYILAALLFLIPLLVPVSSWVIDILIIISFAISITVYLKAATIKDWSDFKTFPTVILLSAVFRISLSIAITKKILTDGSPGVVIEQFGKFVIGSNAIVGFVVFIIIIVVQFIIANGAGRLSEVSARFTLDSLPGKQMSIDADLGSGAINQDEAKKRRAELDQQVDFFGHMDGAGKFVKGDVWLNIIVIFVNIIGGLIVGMMILGMDFSTAINHFTVLTIGDGIVAVLCSFLITVGSAMVMSRVDDGSDKGMMNNLFNEMLFNPLVNYIVSGIFGLLALTGIFTDLPFLPFAIMSGVMGYVGYIRTKELEQEKIIKAKEKDLEEKENLEKYKNENNNINEINPIMLEVGFALIPIVNTEKNGVNIKDKIGLMRKNIARELGVKVPKIRVTDDSSLNPYTKYNIKIKDIIVASGEIQLNSLLALKTPYVLKEIEGIPTLDPIYGEEAVWITEEKAKEAKDMQYKVMDPLTIISAHLSESIKTHIYELLDRQQVYELVQEVGQKHKVLLDEIEKPEKGVELSMIQGVLKNLLREGISIKDMPTILEGIIDGSKLSEKKDDVTMIVRERLAKQICENSISPEDGKIHVILLPDEIEREGQVRLTHDGNFLSMDVKTERAFVESLKKQYIRASMGDIDLVVLTTRNDLRFAISRALNKYGIPMNVMLQSELVQGFQAEYYGTLEIE